MRWGEGRVERKGVRCACGKRWCVVSHAFIWALGSDRATKGYEMICVRNMNFQNGFVYFVRPARAHMGPFDKFFLMHRIDILVSKVSRFSRNSWSREPFSGPLEVQRNIGTGFCRQPRIAQIRGGMCKSCPTQSQY